MFVEERLRRDEKSRRAVSALGGAQVGKGDLQRMQPSIARQSFDGRDGPAGALDAEHETGQHRQAVEEHRAGAALAELASVLRPAEIQVLTKHFEQRLVRREGDLERLAVHRQVDVRVFGHA
jgi:hypothetical protein